MVKVPGISAFDSSILFLRQGYEFISNQCQARHTDIFETRLLLFKVTCLKGEEAAEIFYDNNRFQRQGAFPGRGRATLVGRTTVQNLDGEMHRARKAMLMSLMGADAARELSEMMASHWRAKAKRWEQQDRIQLFYESSEILCRTICTWAGVPLTEAEVGSVTRDFMAVIDSPAGLGWRHWRGRLARARLDRWLGKIIEAVRAQRLPVSKGSALDIIAHYRGPDGERLDAHSAAAAELNNVLRPTIAIGRYIVFVAHALHEHPRYRESLKTGTDEDRTYFVQEVRRLYPFFPVTAALVKQAFDWKGHHFPKGRWVLLDLYGTNRDSRSWDEPNRFKPERFRDWDGSAFNLIPQGGGNHYQHHRCAGEWITIALMKEALRLLTQEMEYQVPPQDLRIDKARLPAIPESRFLMGNVRLNETPQPARRKQARVEPAH